MHAFWWKVQCWQTGYTTSPALPDLKTEDLDIRNIFQEWIAGLVSDVGSMFTLLPLVTFKLISIVDGLRIDTAKNVESSFFPGFTKAASVFCIGEVLDGAPSIVCPYNKVLDSTLNYPVYVSDSVSVLYSLTGIQILPVGWGILLSYWRHFETCGIYRNYESILRST